MEWPPKSGQMKQFPEIDKGEFFLLSVALRKINQNQAEFLKRLGKHLGSE
jgi:predicted NUDIX family NTP pyrophosphohydrolase